MNIYYFVRITYNPKLSLCFIQTYILKNWLKPLKTGQYDILFLRSPFCPIEKRYFPIFLSKNNADFIKRYFL